MKVPTMKSSASAVLDALERASILALYAWFVARIAASMGSGAPAVNGLLLVSEGLVIACLLARTPSREMSLNPLHWLLAIAATCGPLLVTPGEGRPVVPASVGAGLWLAGTLVQLWAKLSLGRSFGCVPANRGLKSGGPYHFVRHPMYAGYFLSHVAFLLMNPTPWNLAIYALCDLIQVPRILVEEHLLARDPAYCAYRDEVRWRVVPGLF
jgi:protein-S-isoprenylcysteine O-methyltransferase Ste14